MRPDEVLPGLTAKSRGPKRQVRARFHWQSGYGAFSVSAADVEEVVEHVAQQEIHHRVVSFQEEFPKLAAHLFYAQYVLVLSTFVNRNSLPGPLRLVKAPAADHASPHEFVTFFEISFDAMVITKEFSGSRRIKNQKSDKLHGRGLSIQFVRLEENIYETSRIHIRSRS